MRVMIFKWPLNTMTMTVNINDNVSVNVNDNNNVNFSVSVKGDGRYKRRFLCNKILQICYSDGWFSDRKRRSKHSKDPFRVLGAGEMLFFPFPVMESNVPISLLKVRIPDCPGPERVMSVVAADPQMVVKVIKYKW